MPLHQIAARVAPGATLIDHARLQGGVSALVTSLTLRLPSGALRRVVVRQQDTTTDWKIQEADAIATEFGILRALHAAGQRVPAPLLLDTSCRTLPSPYLVMAHIDGTTDEPPDFIGPMVDALAALHALDPERLGLPGLPRRDSPHPEVLDHLPAGFPDLRERITALAPWEPLVRPSLLHGDYWSGNILWRGGQIVALIDWEDAAVGDPLADLAGARVELLWRHGDAVSTEFTQRYAARTGRDLSRLPLWDLYVSSAGLASMPNWGLAPDVLARWQARTRAHIARAATRARSLMPAAGRGPRG